MTNEQKQALTEQLSSELHRHAPDCPAGSVLNMAARVLELLELGDKRNGPADHPQGPRMTSDPLGVLALGLAVVP